MIDDEAVETSPPEPIDELTELKTKCAEYLNGWKRAKADYTNAERAWRAQQVALVQYAEERILHEILEIADALDEAVRHTRDEGIEQVRRKILSILAREKVTPIVVAEGDVFDPHIHEALSGEGEQIAMVIRNGYMYGDQLLRPVQVMVK